MNRIYFIRHGEGQDNVARKFSSIWFDNHYLGGDAYTTVPALPPLSSVQEK
jgi:hypothetical protein